jgi:hypothetical protein
MPSTNMTLGRTETEFVSFDDPGAQGRFLPASRRGPGLSAAAGLTAGAGSARPTGFDERERFLDAVMVRLGERPLLDYVG